MRHFHIAGMLAAILMAATSHNSCIAEEKSNVVAAGTKSAASPTEMAAQLILRGEATQSPLLLLAAADLLDSTTPGDRDPSEVVSELSGESATPSGKVMPEFHRSALEDRALEMAKDEAEKTLVQAWIDKPRARGLEVSQGRDLESVEIKGVTYKVLFRGVLDNGYHRIWRDIKFEGKRPARVLVIGDGDGDLDLWVYDSDTDGLIDSDTDNESVCLADWTPKRLGPFDIKVANVGEISERYVVLVNW